MLVLYLPHKHLQHVFPRDSSILVADLVLDQSLDTSHTQLVKDVVNANGWTDMMSLCCGLTCSATMNVWILDHEVIAPMWLK